MQLKVSYYQLKIDLYLHNVLYKPYGNHKRRNIVDRQKIKRKELEYTLQKKITKEDRKSRRKEQKN